MNRYDLVWYQWASDWFACMLWLHTLQEAFYYTLRASGSIALTSRVHDAQRGFRVWVCVREFPFRLHFECCKICAETRNKKKKGNYGWPRFSTSKVADGV